MDKRESPPFRLAIKYGNAVRPSRQELLVLTTQLRWLSWLNISPGVKARLTCTALNVIKWEQKKSCTTAYSQEEDSKQGQLTTKQSLLMKNEYKIALIECSHLLQKTMEYIWRHIKPLQNHPSYAEDCSKRLKLSHLTNSNIRPMELQGRFLYQNRIIAQGGMLTHTSQLAWPHSLL